LAGDKQRASAALLAVAKHCTKIKQPWSIEPYTQKNTMQVIENKQNILLAFIMLCSGCGLAFRPEPKRTFLNHP
jgi:hypothetical protein